MGDVEVAAPAAEAPESPAAVAPDANAAAAPAEPAAAPAPAPASPPAPENSMTVLEATERLKVLAKITRPSMDEHQAKVGAIGEEIRALKDKVEDIRRQMDEAQQARAGSRTEWSEARSVLTQLKAERDAARAALDAVKADRVAAREKMEGLSAKKRAMQAESKHSTIEEVDEAIRKLENRQQTVSMSLPEEKKLLKEIQALKDSKKVVSQLGGQEETTRSAQEHLDAMKSVENEKWTEFKEINEKCVENEKWTEFKEINEKRTSGAKWTEFKEINEKLKLYMTKNVENEQWTEFKEINEKNIENKMWTKFKEINDKFKAQMAVMDELKMKRGDEPDPYKDLLEGKKALHTEIGAKMDAQRELYAAFKDANEKFGAAIREQRQLREHIKKLEFEARRAAALERKRLIEEEEAKKIPYEEEMALCDQLATYLTVSFMPKPAKEAAAAAADKPAEKAPESDEFEGKTLRIKKRDEEEFFVVKGGKKGKAGRRASG
ncbi:hypothetical protein JKP88DRAFT_267401, partial [Tribonema minus]